MRTLAILAGLLLMVFGLIFLGLDLMNTLEAHGFLVTSTIGDVWARAAPGGAEPFIHSVCAPLPASCSALLHKGLHIYAWIVPGILGVALIWLATARRQRRS